MFSNFLANLRARQHARRIARMFGLEIRPNDTIHGTWLCADEPDRFVVRVFVGERALNHRLGPPWQDCLIVSVDKSTRRPSLVSDDARYRPTLR